MLHTIAHYGYLTAYAFTFVCAILLLFLAAAWVDTLKEERGNLVWEVPATVAGLGAFWGLVAVVLHTL
jgi:hypothetical protein